MTINIERELGLGTLKITGRLDTTTLPNLDSVINELPKIQKSLFLIFPRLNTYPRQGSEFC